MRKQPNPGLLCVLAVLALLLLSCSKEGSSRNIVARVDGREITADEFAFAYELSPRQITSQAPATARRAVLDQITRRILLAREGERLGLARDSVLQRAVDHYRRLAVNRELYRQYVRNRYETDENAERQAYLRANTKLFVQHHVDGKMAGAQAIISGEIPLNHMSISPYVETMELAGFGIVDIVSWNTVDTEIEELLFNLPIRQFSKPLEFNGEYHVFRVVETERNILTRDNDFRTQQESLRGVLRKRWERVAAAEFVEQCLADQNLIIKADPLNRLTEYIWANRPVDTNREIQFITNEEINFITQSLADLAETPIAVFKDGQFTVDEILFNYKINPIKLNYDSIPELRENLKNIVAIYVRDWVLSEKGIREKLDRRPAVIEEEQSRREQLLAEKMLRKFAGELDLDKHEIAEQNKIFDNYVSDYVARLKAEADLEVFESNLLAVCTSDAGLSRKIDFMAVHMQ